MTGGIWGNLQDPEILRGRVFIRRTCTGSGERRVLKERGFSYIAMYLFMRVNRILKESCMIQSLSSFSDLGFGVERFARMMDNLILLISNKISKAVLRTCFVLTY